MATENEAFYPDPRVTFRHALRVENVAGIFRGLHFHPSRVSRARSVVANSLWLSSRAFLNSAAIGLADTIALAAALAAGGAARYIFARNLSALPLWAPLLIPAWWIGSFMTGLLPGWGLSAVDHLRRQIVLITALFWFGAALMFFTKTAEVTSRVGLGSAWLSALLLVPIARAIVRNVLCRHQLYGMPTVLIGRAQPVQEMAERLKAEPGLGYFPIGVYIEEETFPTDLLPVVGNFAHIMPVAPAAIVVSAGMDTTTNHAVLNRVLAVYSNVTIIPDFADVPSSFVESRDFSGTIGIEISQTLLSPLATVLKRTVDLFIVTVAAPFWLPILGLACAMIWLRDGHSPIFRQRRSGQGARSFDTLKIRTMVPDAEKVLKKYLEKNPEARAQWLRDFKLDEDPRITPFGKFLRRTSIDELPQLVNVLRGDMSLVGPRPLPEYHLEKLSSALRKLRAQVRPGMTGLWQVSGRSDVGTVGMMRWDHYYVRNWSLWLDAVIFLRTARAVIQGSGAR